MSQSLANNSKICPIVSTFVALDPEENLKPVGIKLQHANSLKIHRLKLCFWYCVDDMSPSAKNGISVF